VSEYGSFYEAMRDLRNSSASFIALRYGVLTKQPAYSLDFINEYYRAAGVKSNLNPAVTHSRAGQATMTDSDGEIKWAPHNLLTYSEDFSNWSKTLLSSGTEDSLGYTPIEASNTGTSLRYLLRDSSVISGATYTFSFDVKARESTFVQIGTSTGFASGPYVTFNLSTGEIGGSSGDLSPTITNIGPDEYRVSATAPATSSTSGARFVIAIVGSTDAGRFATYSATQGDGILIRKAHLYRSDLGGMVNNPDTGDSYVRTAGRVIGSELVTNGDFATNVDGWTTTGSATVTHDASGAALVDVTGTGGGIADNQVISTVAGKVYQLAADIKLGTYANSSFNVVINGVVSGYSGITSTYQTFTTIFVASDTDLNLEYKRQTANTGTLLIDNVSVKELDVNPATARYLPRVGHHIYNGSAWANEGVLHESEARTNLLTYSQDFSNSGWGKVNSSVSANATTAPDGTTTADKIIPDTSTNQHRVDKTPTSSAGDQTFSVYVKDAGYGFAWMRIGSKGARFSIADGTTTSISAGVTASSQDVGNGWRLLSISYSASANDIARINALEDQNTSDFAGDGTSGIYVWGAQLEAGVTPSSYIPTSGSTVTRAAETLTVPAANMPWPTPVETTGIELVTNGTFTGTGNLTGWTLDGDATNNNGVDVFKATAGATTNVLVTCNGLSAEVGKVYKITYDRISGVGFFLFGGVLTTISLAAGTTTSYVVAASTGPLIYLTGSANETSSMDNVSVKEINPLSVSIQMDGKVTFADTAADTEAIHYRWQSDSNNFIQGYISTAGGDTGEPVWAVKALGVADYVTGTSTYYSPDINVPFNRSSRYGSTFINGAVDGTALTANTTPVALPDLSTTDLQLGYDFMGTIGKFRVWSDDLTDTGIATASAPSTEPSLQLTFDGSSTSSFKVLDWSE
jgi:hypothetical protein